MTGTTQEAVKNQVVRLDEISAHKSNYNQHSPAQIARIANSLRTFGQVRSIVCWRNTILAGHGVVEAARSLGWDTIRADDVSHLTEDQALAYVVADNELARQSDPDQAQLAAILEELQAREPLLVEAAGYGAAELEQLLRLVRPQEPVDAEPQIDRAEELRVKWDVNSGDLWQLGEHRLICGDCTDAGVVARVMAGERCSLVVTDPPYGVEYADKNKFLNSISPGNRIQTPIANDHGSKEETQTLWKSAFGEMSSVMRPGAVVYCFMPQGGDQMMMMMMMMMMGAGIEPRHELIWLKNNHVLGRVDYAYKHEPILYAWKEGGHHFYGDFQTSIIECNRPQNSDMHPTTKPVELIERLVRNSSLEGDAVYDPFAGSGTTGIACHNLGRRARMIEISPAYTAVILERFMQIGVQPELVAAPVLEGA